MKHQQLVSMSYVCIQEEILICIYPIPLSVAVFTTANLEKNPTAQVPPSEIFLTPKPGTMDWNKTSKEQAKFVEDIMERLRQRANQRRVLAKPVFQDFDR